MVEREAATCTTLALSSSLSLCLVGSMLLSAGLVSALLVSAMPVSAVL